MTEERTCNTCNHFNNECYYCRKHDTNQAEWDSCEDHITYDEIVEQENAKELSMIKIGGPDFHSQAREKLIKTLSTGQAKGDLVSIEAMYILAKFDKDSKVVTKPDGIYLSPKVTQDYTKKRSS